MMLAESDIGQIPLLGSFRFRCGLISRSGLFAVAHSSVTSIAISGQLVWASHALSSRPAGTEPSPTSCALPNSSRSNSSGASALQRACPWHLSWSTWILQLSGHGERSLVSAHALLARVAFLDCCCGRKPSSAGASLSYSLLHCRRGCAVKSKSYRSSHSDAASTPPANRSIPTTTAISAMPWFRPRLREAELGGPEAISISALAKKLGVSQPAPYRHFADREALLAAVTAEAFRQFNAVLREAIGKPSKRSKLSRIAQATLAFGLRRNGIYRLMFASRIMAMRAQGQRASSGRAWRPSACCWKRWKRRRSDCCASGMRLKIWAALHGVVMLAEQGLLTGQLAHDQPRRSWSRTSSSRPSWRCRSRIEAGQQGTGRQPGAA